MDYGNNKSGDYGRGKGKNDYSGSKVRYNEKEGTFESAAITAARAASAMAMRKKALAAAAEA